LSKVAKKSWKIKEFFILFLGVMGRNRKATDRNIYFSNGTRGIIYLCFSAGRDTKTDQGVNSVEQEAVDAVSLRARKKKRGRRAKEQIDPQEDTALVESQDAKAEEGTSITAGSTERDEQEKDDIPVIRYTSVRQMRDDIISQEQTILVQRTIRSGQRIFYPGNVVVLGDVNPGGEVIAGGNIIVMGTFRGIAHAGALGNEDAIIAALQLEPSQLRIAGYITRAPEGDYASVYQPEIARVQDGIVIIEKYQPGYDIYHRADRKRGSING
jgi:septum site-determining protein MinC